MARRNARGGRAVGVVIMIVLAGAGAWLLWGRRAGELAAERASAGSDGTVLLAQPRAPSGSRAAGHRERPREAVTGLEWPAALRLATARVREDATAAAGSVSGAVLSSADQRPVTGATVSFARGGTTTDVTTGDDGAFRFEPDQAGRWELAFASAPGHLPYAPEWMHSPITFFTQPGSRIEDVRIYLAPAVAYTGVVVQRDGSEVAGAQVRLLGTGASEQRLSPLADRFVTEADGTFVFTAPDGAVLEAYHPEHGAGRAAVGFGTEVSKRLVIRLDPDAWRPAAASMTGTVRDEAGEPLADVVVRALFEVDNPAAAGADLHPPGQTLTEPDGRFRIDGLEEGGLYTVTASARGHAAARASSIPADADDVDLVLALEATLRGAVSGPDGAAVPAFTVVVREALGAVERRTVLLRSVVDPEGRFEIGGLAPGTYLVQVAAQGHATSEEQSGTAPSTGELRFSLSRGGTLAGRVTSRGGAGVPDARVTLEGGMGEGASAVPLTLSAVTDTEGEYTLSGVGSGACSIRVAAEGHHGRIVSGLRVPPGEVRRADVELTPTEEGEAPRLELAGIGAVLTSEGDVLLLGQVLEGGGAAEAGLVPGDAILTIDGTPVSALGFGGSIERIRGPEGSTVRLRIRRGSGEVADVDVPRRRVLA